MNMCLCVCLWCLFGISRAGGGGAQQGGGGGGGGGPTTHPGEEGLVRFAWVLFTLSTYLSVSFPIYQDSGDLLPTKNKKIPRKHKIKNKGRLIAGGGGGGGGGNGDGDN